MGHVWIIAADETGTSFHWLQSFIFQYTLRGWLNDHGGAAPISSNDMVVKIAQLRFLTELEQWTEEADRVYKELFAVSVVKDIRESSGERGGGMFSYENMKQDRNKIKVSFQVLCKYPVKKDAEAAEVEGDLSDGDSYRGDWE